jgi:tetratricopeptide (TPR) repeat protein
MSGYTYSMKSKYKWILFPVGLILIILGYIFLNQKNTNSTMLVYAPSQPKTNSAQVQENVPPVSAKSNNTEAKDMTTLPDEKAFKSKPSKSIVILNELNFENSVKECFEGKPCKLEGDPWKLYQKFKNSDQRPLNDSLIAFLRKQLTDPNYRDQYKEVLLKMIEDFYPPEKIDWQRAAYYNYLGELQKSLEIYLDLDNKAIGNPKLFNAPKMNIANTYYDLGRLNEALAYYEASLNDPKNESSKDFIYNRIDEIKGKIK